MSLSSYEVKKNFLVVEVVKLMTSVGESVME